MADNSKRKSPDAGKVKKPRPLVRLNGSADERYDSYGYRIDIPKPPAVPSHTAPAPPVSESKRKAPQTAAKPAQKKKAAADKTAPTRAAATARSAAKYGSNRSDKAAAAKKNAAPASEKPKQEQKQKQDPPHEQRIRARSAGRKKALLAFGKVAIFIILAACIIALVLHDKKVDENTPRTAFVSTGTIENSFSRDVNFIREENVVYAGFSGKLISAVNEGDRVAAGNVIGYIVESGYEEDLKKLRNIDSKISAAQSASSYVGLSHNTELAELNKNINDLVLKLSHMSAVTSGMREYSEAMNELDRMFDTKNDIIVNSESPDEYINGLKAERESVLAKLASSMYEIKAEHAGVVSFYVDTQAQNATDKAHAISGYLDKKGETGNMLSETALTYENTQMRCTLNTNVNVNDAVARITADVTYYMTADITDTDAGGLTAGKKITVKGANREFTADATVEEILRYGDRQYVLMKSSSGISGAISNRTMRSDIVMDYIEGIKVPKRALADWDSAGLTARITIDRSNYVSYVFVNVLAEDSEYAIISNTSSFDSGDTGEISTVRINDLYVVNYETVREGEILSN